MTDGELPLLQPQLPEYSGSAEDLAALASEHEFLRTIWTDPNREPIDVQAILPRVVGYIPEQERSTFLNSVFEGNDAEPIRIPQKPRAEDLDSFFPETMALIKKDLAATKFDPNLFDPYFTKSLVKSGNAQLSDVWHIDFTKLNPDSQRFYLSSSYVVASSSPTEFYEGPAQISLKEESSGWLKLKLSLPPEPEEAGRIIQATPFSIIRMTNLTVHRSPVVTESANRSFIRIWCRQSANL